MNKKFIISTIFVLFISIFFFSTCFATNEMNNLTSDIRNFVGGAENTIENTASGIAGSIRDGISSMENNNDNMNQIYNSNTTKNDYTATRTSTFVDSNSGTFLGMSATGFEWFIMAILGIVIVALVWYYGTQNRTITNHNNDNNY